MWPYVLGRKKERNKDTYYKMMLQFPNLRTVLKIFVLVVGLAPSPAEGFAISLSAIASAAATAITTGSSLAGTTLQGISATGYAVTCAIQVENWTRYSLLYPTPRIKGGVMTVAPSPILPGKREALALRKSGSTATGTYGTVSWEVLGTRRRFVIMWSAPFNFHIHSNWMAVGMTQIGFTRVAEGHTWFDQMYYGISNDVLAFERGEFNRVTNPVIYRDDDFEIVGVMTNVHHAQIKITFRPVMSKWHNLAPLIRSVMDHSNSTLSH